MEYGGRIRRKDPGVDFLLKVEVTLWSVYEKWWSNLGLRNVVLHWYSLALDVNSFILAQPAELCKAFWAMAALGRWLLIWGGNDKNPGSSCGRLDLAFRHLFGKVEVHLARVERNEIGRVWIIKFIHLITNLALDQVSLTVRESGNFRLLFPDVPWGYSRRLKPNFLSCNMSGFHQPQIKNELFKKEGKRQSGGVRATFQQGLAFLLSGPH